MRRRSDEIAIECATGALQRHDELRQARDDLRAGIDPVAVADRLDDILDKKADSIHAWREYHKTLLDELDIALGGGRFGKRTFELTPLIPLLALLAS